MSCLCIGGVCIPYTALLPMLLIGLRWIASQFAKVGLLPEFVARRLGLSGSAAPGTSTKDRPSMGNGCVDGGRRGCCGNGGGGGTSPAVDDDGVRDGGVGVVEHVDDHARWEAIFSSSSSSSSSSGRKKSQTTTLFVKFTADWCKPCKSIQPVYASLASRHTNSKGGCTFVTLDVDGEGCDVVSGKYKVGMLPTFVCLVNGNEAGRMSGGNDGDKLGDWVDEMLLSCR